VRVENEPADTDDECSHGGTAYEQGAQGIATPHTDAERDDAE
jgi:hypothetical protein